MNLRTALHLGLITSLGGLMVLWVSELTEETRSENQRGALRTSLMELLQADVRETLELDASRLDEPVSLCDHQGMPQATIIPGTAAGYAGNIEFVMALNHSAQVTGVRVTSHSETPGLGDIIEAHKSDWIHSLSGRDAAETSWELVQEGGDIDGVSGATITLRGLVRGIANTLPQSLPECSE